jgi:hypothetical protein
MSGLATNWAELISLPCGDFGADPVAAFVSAIAGNRFDRKYRESKYAMPFLT